MRPSNRNTPDNPIPPKSPPRSAAARWLGGDITIARRLRATPPIVGNERGVALVMALVLGLVGMLIITALLYMVGTGTWLSGSQKRYQATLEATQGGMSFFVHEIMQRCLGGETLGSLGSYNGLLTQGNGDAIFNYKLTTPGVAGDATGYPATTPDVTMTFLFASPTPNMTVDATILGTTIGNSGKVQTPLGSGGAGDPNTGDAIIPPHVPYLFHTEIQGQSAVSSREKANLSGIYAY